MPFSFRKVLVTGAAGFIGYHLSHRLLQDGYDVVGFDNLNDYYDVRLKEARLQQLSPHPCFQFLQGDLADTDTLNALFAKHKFDAVVNLAAQPGVRYSLINPKAYINSNIVGFANVLEGCRHFDVQHLIYASSSSVYGANTRLPFSTHDNVDHPLSLYAATKKGNELMAHSYSHLYRLPCTGLRFFTVYGPWGRPDMAPMLFLKAIANNEPIKVFNHGRMARDFTYIDDIVEGIIRVMTRQPKPDESWSGRSPDPSSSNAPYRIYNIGNHCPIQLMDFISAIENAIGREAKKEYVDMQPGDVLETHADVTDLMSDTGFAPDTQLKDGVAQLVTWYRDFYSNR